MTWYTDKPTPGQIDAIAKYHRLCGGSPNTQPQAKTKGMADEIIRHLKAKAGRGMGGR